MANNSDELERVTRDGYTVVVYARPGGKVIGYVHDWRDPSVTVYVSERYADADEAKAECFGWIDRTRTMMATMA